MAKRRRGWELPSYAVGPDTKVFQANGIVVVQFVTGTPPKTVIADCETIAQRVDISDSGDLTPVPPGNISGPGAP